jgi:hypothetical protein
LRKLLFPISFLLIAGLAACDDSLCGNTVLHTSRSPDQRHVATLFARDCGATTNESLQIMLSDAAERPSGSGNVFIAELPAQTDFQSESGQGIDIIWQDDRSLLIQFDSQARAFKQESVVEGIKVRYQKMLANRLQRQ